MVFEGKSPRELALQIMDFKRNGPAIIQFTEPTMEEIPGKGLFTWQMAAYSNFILQTKIMAGR